MLDVSLVFFPSGLEIKRDLANALLEGKCMDGASAEAFQAAISARLENEKMYLDSEVHRDAHQIVGMQATAKRNQGFTVEMHEMHEALDKIKKHIRRW